jgi:3-methyladenine DNA glycosylase AlkC
MGQYHRSEVLREASEPENRPVLFLASECCESVDKSRILFPQSLKIEKFPLNTVIWICDSGNIPRDVMESHKTKCREITESCDLAIRQSMRDMAQESDLTHLFCALCRSK